MRGLRKYISPFAPDQAGATAVFYALGGIIIICDAGGCAGNVCGFDEPRWFGQKSAVFSAGLRDMDAILGRDDRLVAKLKKAADQIDANFAAIIGTPVPAVIATDYAALRRMAEKKTGLPVLTIDTTGFELYDRGIEKATLSLVDRFATASFPREPARIGVLGMTPLDFPANDRVRIQETLRGKGAETVCCYGMTDGLTDIIHASAASVNLVVSPGGVKAAELLQKRFGTPWHYSDPLASRLIPENIDFSGKKVLVIHQQVRADALRCELEKRGASVTAGSWFQQPSGVTRPDDIHFTEEDQLEAFLKQKPFDIIIGDSAFRPAIRQPDTIFIDLPHFAVSGR